MKKRLLNLAQIRVYVLIAIHILLTCAVHAQEERIIPRSQGSNYEGNHFYIGFMRNELDVRRNLNAPVFLDIYVASAIPTTVTVRLPWESTGTQYKILGDSILNINLIGYDARDIEMKESEVPQNRLIEITSNQKISVSAMTSYDYTSDAYTALPIPNWGKEYVIMTMPNDNYAVPAETKDVIRHVGDDDERSGEFLVMASEDSTLVQFTPRVRTMKHDSAGYVSVYLMKGQCYLVQSSDSLPAGYGDLTGTIVRSDKPIGVLSGHVRTAIPVRYPDPRYIGRDSKDCLVEMLIPTKLWGTKYVTTPFKIYSSGDLIRVACIQPNTTFTAQGSKVSRTVTLVEPGDWMEFYPVGESLSFKSDKPISIAQYMPTSFFDEVQDFDPALVIIPPVDQYISRALFQIQPNPDWSYFDKFWYQYVNLICEPEALNTIKIDGTLVTAINANILTQVVPGTNLHYISISLQPGVHNIVCDAGKFSGIIYGVGPDDSYAYPLGLSLYKTDIADSIPPIFKYTEDCGDLVIVSTEKRTDSSVGLESIRVIADSTNNFKWTIEDVTDSSVTTEIKAQPIDYNRNAVILVETRDRLGNGRQLKYTFNALAIDVRSNIVFQSVNWLDSICEKVILRNYGTDTINFYGGKLSGDSRIHFNGGDPLQKSLKPSDSIVFYVCFKPLGDSTELKANLSLDLPCNRQLNIPIIGKVAALSIDTLGWDFGRVLVGDTVCSRGLIINDGNNPIEIYSLKIEPFEPSIRIDTAGRLPVTLQPGDSLKIPVCFMPTEVRKIIRHGIAVNSFNLIDNTLTFEGEGVAPLVESVKFDWQKQRTSTQHDSIVTFVNHGNYDALVSYVSASGDTASLSSLAELSLPYTLRPLRPFLDTLRIRTKFIPTDTIAYHSEYTLEVANWKQHKPVTLILDGQGTQPTITVSNIDFDTVSYRKTKDTTAIVIKSGGNEDLTIDTLILASGDVSSFEIDKQYLRGMVLQPNKEYQLPVRFNPQRLGRLTAEILVIHDAQPAFRRDTSLIVLTGFAISIDTLQFSLSGNAPETVHACSSDTIVVDFKNTGNRPLNFQTITSTATNIDLTPVLIPLPQIIECDSSLRAIYTIQMKKGLVGEFKVTVQCNDTIFQTITKTISSISNPLNLTSHPDTTVDPGATIIIPFTGIVDVQCKIPFLLSLSAGFNFQVMTLQSQTGIIEFTDNQQKRTVAAHFSQNRNYVTVKADNEIDIDTLTNWIVKIPFTVMLSDSSNISIPVQVGDTLHECFAEGAMMRTIHVNPVCANLIRRVTASNPRFKLISVSPSPVGETGEARCIIQGKGIVTLEAVNQLGERFVLATTDLNVGEYAIRFSTERLANGVYGFILRAADGREERSVIVIER